MRFAGRPSGAGWVTECGPPTTIGNAPDADGLPAGATARDLVIRWLSDAATNIFRSQAEEMQ